MKKVPLGGKSFVHANRSAKSGASGLARPCMPKRRRAHILRQARNSIGLFPPVLLARHWPRAELPCAHRQGREHDDVLPALSKDAAGGRKSAPEPRRCPPRTSPTSCPAPSSIFAASS